jgi:hypothetical protein
VLPHGTSVEAGAKDDDLPDIRDELLVEVSSEILRPTLTISRTCGNLAATRPAACLVSSLRNNSTTGSR